MVKRLEKNENFVGNIVAEKEENDLALIKTNIDNTYHSFIRMKEGYERALKPKLNERVTTLGFPDEKYGPRGGPVTKKRDPKLGTRGFTIAISTERGASGSPVLDKHGLLIGIVWGGRDYEENGNNKINVYATKNSEITRFLKNNKIKHGVSNIEDFPFKRDSQEDFFEEAERVLEIAGSFTVRIHCKK